MYIQSQCTIEKSTSENCSYFSRTRRGSVGILHRLRMYDTYIPNQKFNWFRISILYEVTKTFKNYENLSINW